MRKAAVYYKDLLLELLTENGGNVQVVLQECDSHTGFTMDLSFL